MRIPLDFDRDGGSIFVNAAIRIRSRSVLFPVAFIVDTGSPMTFIDEFYSSKFRIFAKNLPFDSFIYMGGTKVGLYALDGTEVILRDDRGVPTGLSFDGMKVAKTAWTKREAVYTGESILGLDFMRKLGLVLFVDPGNNLAYLEKK